jgi:hypothetical protein
MAADQFSPARASANMPGADRSVITHHASGALDFIDGAGIRWTVSEIARFDFSERLISLLPHSERRGGWLLFESEGGDRRRLAPIPENWRSLSAYALDDHLGRAAMAGKNENRRRTDPPVP